MKKIDVEEYRKRIQPLPADFDEWVRDSFDGFHSFYLGYITDENTWGEMYEGTRRSIYCPVCEKWGEDNIHKTGEKVVCPYCRSTGWIYSAARKKNPTRHYTTAYYGENLGDGVFVLRTFVCRYEQRSPLMADYDEQFSIEEFESRRLYIGPDSMAKEYRHYDYYVGESKWSTYGADNTNISGPVYPGTYEAMKGTAAEWSCAEQARDCYLFDANEHVRSGWGNGPFNSYGYGHTLYDYLNAYAKDRKLEMLVKLELIDLVKQRLNHISINHNWRAKSPYDYLRVTKSRLKDLMDKPNELKYLRVYQMEKKLGAHWSDEEVEIVSEFNTYRKGLETILQYMSLKQLSNRLNSYAKRSKRRVGDVIWLYVDYFMAKLELGYDMNNTIYQYPKNLKQAHDRAFEEKDERKAAKRIATCEREFANIRKRAKRANKLYGYQKGKRLIRPAQSAGEIITEGQKLHHCVGSGDTYLSRHNEGKDIILFLRLADQPNEPYVTVELSTDGEIMQWYGAYDEKPDEKANNRWLNNYIKQLDVNKVKREMKGAAV